MRKKIFTALTALILCFAVIFSSTVIPASAYAQPDAAVESISIREQSGVLEGETLQLQANIETIGTLFDSVEWSSSNPQAISCTKDGKIEGLVAGKSATITCKAKYGSAKDSITVYCVKELSSQFKSNLKYFLTIVYSQPGTGLKDFCIDLPTLFGPLYQVFYMFSFITSVNSFINGKVTVCGKSGSYAYIRYGENNLLDGFVKNSSLKNTGNAFLTLSTEDMNVWADGVAYESRKLTTKYKGDVEWIYDKNSDYFNFDEKTGQVVGLVPGKKVTITAKADGETATCTIHLLYKWPQAWTAKTNRNTNIYYAVGNGYNKGSTSLPTGTEFVVQGDCGTSDGWAYGYISGTENWGFIPISHISTKGTISYYNSLGWSYPIENTNFKQISSVYGWRKGKRHLGFDISNSSILGEKVVAPFEGKVVFVNKEYDYSENLPNYGYCIIIESDTPDPVSGNKLRVVYMHLNEPPDLTLGKKVIPGQELGFIGTTGNSTGPHLHLEVNNKGTNFAGMDNDDSFDKTINPIYFYLDLGLKDDSDSTFNEYWYNDNK